MDVSLWKLVVDSSSIIGLLVTIWVAVQTRKIRMSFVRKARLPEVTKELAKETSNLSKNLKSWKEDKQPTLQTFAKVKGLLENIKPKLPSEDKKKVAVFLIKLHPKKYLIIQSSVSELTEDLAWGLYTDLNTIVTSLHQLEKDLKWD